MRKFCAAMCAAALGALLCAGAALADAGDGLVRVVIKGTDVNLRWYPDTKDSSTKAGKANTGDAFIAESAAVENYASKSDPRWYRLLCPAGKIADGWIPRLVSARFAEAHPLSAGDLRALASLSYGKPQAARAMKTAADYIAHGPREIAGDLADFASRYGGKAESFYTEEFPGMLTQTAAADGVTVFFRHFADADGLITRANAEISRQGLSMGALTVGETTRDDARGLLGAPDESSGDEDIWGEGATLTIGYDERGQIKSISVWSDL